jgi:hypothetical protein
MLTSNHNCSMLAWNVCTPTPTHPSYKFLGSPWLCACESWSRLQQHVRPWWKHSCPLKWRFWFQERDKEKRRYLKYVASCKGIRICSSCFYCVMTRPLWRGGVNTSQARCAVTELRRQTTWSWKWERITSKQTNTYSSKRARKIACTIQVWKVKHQRTLSALR